MRRIEVSLPTIGQFQTYFFKESEALLGFFGDKELSRLDDIEHLGISSREFTGANHSRLEYALLQCALVQQMRVFFKDDEEFSLGNSVKLDGPRELVSSGEELLKSWVWLGAQGRPKWTYGPEKILLRIAHSDADIRQWLTTSTSLLDLRSWIDTVIENRRYDQFHLVLLLRRIANGKAYDRRKTLFRHLVRNKVLPLDSLSSLSSKEKLKISRLRELSSFSRLLAVVCIDSYNSHVPINLPLNAIINSVQRYFSSPQMKSEFLAWLESLAGRMADELYLSPGSAALQQEYESRNFSRVSEQLKKAVSLKRLDRELENLMRNGWGKPNVGALEPLTRFTIEKDTYFEPGRGDEQKFLIPLKNAICTTDEVCLGISQNRFSNVLHLDVFVYKGASKRALSKALAGGLNFLVRNSIFQTRSKLREDFPSGLGFSDVRRRLFPVMLRKTMLSNTQHFSRALDALVNSLLPLGWRYKFENERMHNNESYDFGMRWKCGRTSFDNLTGTIDDDLTINSCHLDAPRLQEIAATKSILNRTNAEFVAAALEPIKICDEYGKSKDQWDGLIVISENGALRIRIIEAKSQRKSAGSDAFKQLARTIDIVRPKITKFRRTRLAKLGAYVELEF